MSDEFSLEDEPDETAMSDLVVPDPDDEAMERLLAWPFGRLVLWQILQHCGVYRTSYLGGPGQGEMSAYLEGRRSVGLFLIDWLERVDRRAYPQLILDQVSKAEQHEGASND